MTAAQEEREGNRMIRLLLVKKWLHANNKVICFLRNLSIPASHHDFFVSSTLFLTAVGDDFKTVSLRFKVAVSKVLEVVFRVGF